MNLLLRAVLLVLVCTTLPAFAAGAPDAKPAQPWPLWDGKETVAEYARRAGLEATKTLDLGGGVKLETVLIPAGKFVIGSPETEAGRTFEETQHEVTITKPFYMAKYETMQEQYEAIAGNNPSAFKEPKNPVEQVSWTDVQEFCRKLSTKTGMTVRLPSEAEWEYSCRAGTKTRFYSGEDDQALDSVAWHGANADKTTHPVGQKTPNAWGLFDMHGNVFEWCSDWKQSEYPPGAVTDPTGPATGHIRVVRGGSWNFTAAVCRSTFRGESRPETRLGYLGFRVVVEVSKRP
ncbi:MAG TPA: formylglycine-generating enzyme family protein [Planctomycetota bacterium]|jgi:formylglycine-generating enzyme required for sulfatase activity